MLIDSNELREKAYAEFQRIAKAETANGAETLAIFSLVRKFSTAPQDELDSYTDLFKYWSRKGDADALLQYGGELYYGGYDPDLYEEGAPLHEYRLKGEAWLAQNPK